MSTSAERTDDGSSSQMLIENTEPQSYRVADASSYHAPTRDDDAPLDDGSYETYKKPDAGARVPTTKAGPVKQWMLECLSCLIAVVSLGAIVVTLLIHDTRELPDWPLQISVNALVSIFAVIMKIAMLHPVTEAISQLKWSWFRKPRPLTDFVHFDDASRGLWGCTTLIVRLRGLHLASLGAFIYLLATASDPFVQQVVRYVTCTSILHSNDATIARTNNYNQSGIHQGALDSSLDIPMQVAIYKGIYNAYTPISPQCSTGNCTFSEYRTLGMCSQCSDITDQAQYFKNITSSTGNYTYDTVIRLPAATAMGNALEVHLPYNSQLAVDSDVNVTDPEAIVRTRFLQLDVYAKNFDRNSPKAQAFECLLAPCVRTYKASVTNGRTTEELISEHRASGPRDTPMAQFRIAPMPCLLNRNYYDASSFSERNASNWRPMIGALPQNQTAWLPDDCWFSMNNGVLALRNYLLSFLKGSGLYGTTSDFSTQSWIGLIYKSGTSLQTLNRTWSELAESMTIQMRRAGTNSTRPATGQVFSTGTCIDVQWAWLSFPIILLAASIVLLVATIVHSRKVSARQIWKSSPLAILYHGLSGALKERGRDVDNIDDMKKMSKEVYTTLYDEGHGVELAERPGPYTTGVTLNTLETIKEPQRTDLAIER